MRYKSADEDSARWDGFPFRDGDIVISTRSKSGTTWMQMICALLIFQTPDLPAPLAQLSPWVDWTMVPREEVIARLAAQPHRRFLKTHLPLDGIPRDKRVTYIITGRHPLDAMVSLIHQSGNFDKAKRPERSVHEQLVRFIDNDWSPREFLDSLRGVFRHLTGAWSMRDEPNIVLVHYADLVEDLPGEMRRLAGLLDIGVSEERWPVLVRAATFGEMRARADTLAPDPLGTFKDRNAFFRRGTSGNGRELLTPEELARYHARAASLAPADLLAWLHR